MKSNFANYRLHPNEISAVEDWENRTDTDLLLADTVTSRVEFIECLRHNVSHYIQSAYDMVSTTESYISRSGI